MLGIADIYSWVDDGDGSLPSRPPSNPSFLWPERLVDQHHFNGISPGPSEYWKDPEDAASFENAGFNARLTPEVDDRTLTEMLGQLAELGDIAVGPF